MNERPTLKIDLNRATRKVDTLELNTEARRSMGLLGPPVSVTKDPEFPPRAKAALVGFALAVVVNLFLFVRCERRERFVPPMPPVERPALVPTTLMTVELTPPRSEAPTKPTAAKKVRRSWIAEPLFSKGKL